MQEKLENEIEYVITQVSFQTMYYFHITQTSLIIVQHILILFDKNFQPTYTNEKNVPTPHFFT